MKLRGSTSHLSLIIYYLSLVIYYLSFISSQILFLTFMAAQNVAMCHPHLEMFSGARGAARSLYRLLQRSSRINALERSGARPDAFRGDITFENLYFNYPSRPDVKVCFFCLIFRLCL